MARYLLVRLLQLRCIHIDFNSLISCTYTLVCLHFVSTGDPKIGVYMLNSGGKDLYVKVSFSILLCHRLWHRYSCSDVLLYVPAGLTGAVKSRGQPEDSSGFSETRSKKLHWSCYPVLQRWICVSFLVRFPHLHLSATAFRPKYLQFVQIKWKKCCVFNRFGARTWKKVHSSCQFKDLGKQDDLQLPWTTYHKQVRWRVRPVCLAVTDLKVANTNCRCLY